MPFWAISWTLSSSFMIGACFQLKALIDEPHYWFVVLGPYKGKYLCVNATDAKRMSDHSCLLRSGCHPQITKDSAIFYKKSQIWSAAKLEAELKSGTNLRVYSSCSPELVNRILKGALQSEFLPLDLLKWVGEAMESNRE